MSALGTGIPQGSNTISKCRCGSLISTTPAAQDDDPVPWRLSRQGCRTNVPLAVVNRDRDHASKQASIDMRVYEVYSVGIRNSAGLTKYLTQDQKGRPPKHGDGWLDGEWLPSNTADRARAVPKLGVFVVDRDFFFFVRQVGFWRFSRHGFCNGHST